MKTASVLVEGISPYSQARYHNTEKLPKELNKDYEARTWRNRLHINDDGYVFIPPMSFKLCLGDAARFTSLQIPGKGKSTYTKHFASGVLIAEALILPTKAEDVCGDWVLVPSDGMRGGTKRVEKRFPVIKEWGGEINIYILDELITKDVLQEHLTIAGSFIGIGRWRPQKEGIYGRFKATVRSFS